MTMIPVIQQWKTANILQFPVQGQSTASVNLCRHKGPNARRCCAESEKRDTVGGAAVSLSILVSLDVEINPRFYRGKKSERSDNRKGELDASRKTLKREEPPV